MNKNHAGKSIAKTSKFLSLVLRHRPEIIGLELDRQGWAEVDDLLTQLGLHGRSITQEQLVRVVEENDKQRFRFNGDRTRIRASQGHSVAIDLALPPKKPPTQLFHGTATRFLDSIRQQGLLSRSRQHVHLSQDKSTAEKVGKRHGSPVILVVDSEGMSRDSLEFFLSDNGVWLTEKVPEDYIEFPKWKPI
ncbi:MAG: RNA 2'-phosphotransferase [Cyanobacteria bacterium P01_D01_bin.73]